MTYTIRIEGEGVNIERRISPDECRRIMNVVLSEEEANAEELRKLGTFTTALRKSGLVDG
ncbi:MAG: hypothetical protein JO166_22275 [Deltaproteobacteria bacterium]|nr:hypothetical protein [Deltaproteobacteria bacterium]